MEYIAKQKEKPVTSVLPEYFELKVAEEAEDIDGNKVTVLKSIGSFNLNDLVAQKEFLLNQIAEIDAKIDAINKIKNDK